MWTSVVLSITMISISCGVYRKTSIFWSLHICCIVLLEKVDSTMLVGRFISSSYKYTIYNIVIELPKTIKKSMATGITPKSCTALFPLWSLRKNDISKMKKYIKRKHREHWKEFSYLNVEKIKTKSILILIML